MSGDLLINLVLNLSRSLCTFNPCSKFSVSYLCGCDGFRRDDLHTQESTKTKGSNSLRISGGGGVPQIPWPQVIKYDMQWKRINALVTCRPIYLVHVYIETTMIRFGFFSMYCICIFFKDHKAELIEYLKIIRTKPRQSLSGDQNRK